MRALFCPVVMHKILYIAVAAWNSLTSGPGHSFLQIARGAGMGTPACHAGRFGHPLGISEGRRIRGRDRPILALPPCLPEALARNRRVAGTRLRFMQLGKLVA